MFTDRFYHRYSQVEANQPDNKKKRKKRVSVAAILVKTGVGKITRKPKYEVRIGVSVCSKKDLFIRKKGRMIAEKRAEFKPYQTFKVSNKEVEDKNFVREVLIPKMNEIIIANE